jgi:hypothetical protein
MDSRKETLLEEARRVADLEAQRQQPAAALITGSVAWGPVSARSDIDIVFITHESHGVSYRYYMPRLTGIPVRTEVGRIPVSHLERVLATGYSDDISTGLREQLRNARVLFGDSDLAADITARFENLKPKKKLLGEYLLKAKQAFAKAKGLVSAKAPLNCILALDEVAQNLWRLVLVARHQIGIQKDKHEVRAARRHLSEADLATYCGSRRISAIGKEDAVGAIRAAQMMLSKMLDQAGIDAKILGELEEA